MNKRTIYSDREDERGYLSPTFEVLDIRAERGFAESVNYDETEGTETPDSDNGYYDNW